MNQINGGLAAYQVLELAKQIKAAKEDELRNELRRVIHEKLGCPTEVGVPERLVNALMRSAKLNADTWSRIEEAAQSLAREIALITLERQQPRPDWVTSMLAESAKDFHDKTDRTAQFDLILRDVAESEIISELRSAAQATRNQSSFLSGVCRLMTQRWIDEVADLGRHLGRRMLENKQEHFITFPIESTTDLARWAELLFDYFNTIAESSDDVKGHRSKLVSPSAVRTYKNAWDNFVKRNGHQIFDQMLQSLHTNSPTRKELEKHFYGSERGASTKDVRLNLRDTMQEEPESRRHFLQALTALEPTTYAASRGAEMAPTAGDSPAVEQSRLHNIFAKRLNPNSVTISIDFRDSDAQLQSMSMSWPTLDEAIAHLTEWFYTRQSLIGNVVIELARIEVAHEGNTEKHELVQKTLNNIEEFFYKVITLPHVYGKP